MKTKIIIGIIVSLFGYACEKTIEFKGSNIEPKIVVNGNLVAQNPINISIYKSRSLLSNEDFFEALPNAKADLFENNTFVETLTYTGKVDTFVRWQNYGVIKKTPYKVGSYSGKTIPKEGNTYRLEVTCDGFTPVFCQTTVPVAIKILKADTASQIFENEAMKRSYLEITLHFKDAPHENNYYRIESELMTGIIQNFYAQMPGLPFSPSDTIRTTHALDLEIYHNPILKPQGKAEDVIFDEPVNQFAIFNDTYFDGKENKFSVYLNNDYRKAKFDFGNFLLRKISLISLSKEYYNYLNTANIQSWHGEDPFSEPVQVTSNVVGGMGIFGSSNVSSYELLFGNYPIKGKTYLPDRSYYEGY